MKSSFTILLTIIVFVLLSAGTAKSQADAEKQDGEQKFATKIKIKSKPRASTGGNCRNTTGMTILRVTFDKSAKVTNVEMVASSGCEYFDRSAVKAAGKIKFKPATKKGEPITIVKTVSYSFVY